MHDLVKAYIIVKDMEKEKWMLFEYVSCAAWLRILIYRVLWVITDDRILYSPVP